MMDAEMTTATVPVDLMNPGQVFACLGLAETAAVLRGEATARFDWSSEVPCFQLYAPGPEDPVEAVLTFLAEAEVVSLVPSASALTTRKWDVPEETVTPGAAFPMPEPPSPATLPARLHTSSHELIVDYWGDGTRRDNAKFWAGAAGFPGVGLLRKALDLVRDRLRTPAAPQDPFNLSAPQTSSFRFDWRRDYVPLGVGFSLNAHSDMDPLGYPLVEVLAAIGLTHARPARPEPRNKLLYRYAVVGHELPLPLLRAALGGAVLPFPTRTFRMVLDWPGQKNQARCITDVVEET